MDHGLGEMQCSGTGRLDHNLAKSAIEDSSWMDSGVNLSFRSDSSRLNSKEFDKHQNISFQKSLITSMAPLLESTSFDSGCAPSIEKVPSLNTQLQNLRLEEEKESGPVPAPVPATAQAPPTWRPMTFAELRGRTKEQKLRDMDCSNMRHTKEVRPRPPRQSDNLDCYSIRCSSLTEEEEERPQHFQQDTTALLSQF